MRLSVSILVVLLSLLGGAIAQSNFQLLEGQMATVPMAIGIFGDDIPRCPGGAIRVGYHDMGDKLEYVVAVEEVFRMEPHDLEVMGTAVIMKNDRCRLKISVEEVLH